MLVRRLVIAMVAVGMTVIAAPAGTVAAAVRVPAFPGKVYVFVGENTSLSQLTAKNAPFQLGTIKPHSAWFSDYWGISHYSTSNYMAMTSGTYDRCDQLDEKPATCNHDSVNIFGMLEDAGISWAAWNESMPENCYLVSAGENRYLNSYRVKHNPAAYYHDIVGSDFSQATGTDPNAPCQTKVIPMGGTGPNDTSAFEAPLGRTRRRRSTTSCRTCARTATTTVTTRRAARSSSSTTSSRARSRPCRHRPRGRRAAT